ncbi:MAG TPA: ABC transporter permease [Candidatus Dojkabacteria bacterium]|nr:ABC transporter permease [Candidatus Dojkabacteria bacterium]
MTFLNIIVKNLWRHRIRTILTVLGISISISMVVAFGFINEGINNIFGDFISNKGKTDFSVLKAGAADLILSYLSEEQVDQIRQTEGVEQAVPYIMAFTKQGDNPFFIVGGLEAETISLAGYTIIEGRIFFDKNEVLVGKVAAVKDEVKVGGEFELNGELYKVSGIYESGISFQDSGAIASLELAQEIQGITGQVNMVYVKVAEGYDIKEVARKVDDDVAGVVSVFDIQEYEGFSEQAEIGNAIFVVFSFLIILIGAVGVMNTIIMSVFERTKEIGVLRALGWTRLRIVLMIMGESVILGLLSAATGIFLGVLMVYAASQTEFGKAWLVITYSATVFIRAIGIALGVVLIGSIYPALRAAKLQPTEALRYE